MFGIESKDELIRRARTQSEKLSDGDEKDLWAGVVEQYYLSRFFVSVYEARNYEVPTQVWNEYRNALDHYLRHLTLKPQERGTASHLQKMRGHLQRALLDVLKLISFKTELWFKEEFNRQTLRALTLVDNGEFVPRLNSLRNDAETKFEKAKTKDYSLGEDAKENKAIITLYMDAAFAY